MTVVFWLKSISTVAIRAAFFSIGYESPTDDQRLSITEFNLSKGKDVFVCLPTGEGKSLCFVTLPAVQTSSPSLIVSLV